VRSLVRLLGTSHSEAGNGRRNERSAFAVSAPVLQRAIIDIPAHRLAPYEKRVIELLRNSKDKRARRLAKKRVRYPSRGLPSTHL
jgi:hypothetical protein